MSSAYIIDRTSNHHDLTKTPYEKFTGIKPNITNLHVWGCDVHYYNHEQNNKLSSKSKPGIFVGYDTNDTYYRILDIDNNKIIITLNVMK
jgi:hypothetical protein